MENRHNYESLPTQTKDEANNTKVKEANPKTDKDNGQKDKSESTNKQNGTDTRNNGKMTVQWKTQENIQQHIWNDEPILEARDAEQRYDLQIEKDEQQEQAENSEDSMDMDNDSDKDPMENRFLSRDIDLDGLKIQIYVQENSDLQAESQWKPQEDEQKGVFDNNTKARARPSTKENEIWEELMEPYYGYIDEKDIRSAKQWKSFKDDVANHPKQTEDTQDEELLDELLREDSWDKVKLRNRCYKNHEQNRMIDITEKQIRTTEEEPINMDTIGQIQRLTEKVNKLRDQQECSRFHMGEISMRRNTTNRHIRTVLRKIISKTGKVRITRTNEHNPDGTIRPTTEESYNTKESGDHTQTGQPVSKITIRNMEATKRTDHVMTGNIPTPCYLDTDAKWNTPATYDKLEQFDSGLYNNAYENWTVLTSPGVRRFRTPKDSQTEIIISEEIHTRPEDLTIMEVMHIEQLHKALRWKQPNMDKMRTEEYKIFPEWDSDIELTETKTGTAETTSNITSRGPETKIMLKPRQRETYTKHIPGQQVNESYWYTEKGQWRARHTRSEAERLLMLRDMIKAMEERYLFLVHQIRQEKEPPKEEDWISSDSEDTESNSSPKNTRTGSGNDSE
jgi:hypothetical protein